jgi:hypothetical protein
VKILVVGGGHGSGASAMRAEQLGGAIGARVHVDPWADPFHDPLRRDLEWADFVIIVKRLKKRWNRWLAVLAQSRKPVVWDALDFWKQPELNAMTRQVAIKSFHKRKGELGARLVIAATERMAKDCGAVYLPHHARIGLSAKPVRPAVEVVGYEGSDRYLEEWRPAIEAECARRGWRFAMNPPDLAEVDLVVAFRGGAWDGWACRQWKSGVKIGNAIVAGRPIITQPCAAFEEMRPAGATITQPGELAEAFDAWAPCYARSAAATAHAAKAPAYDLAPIAARYAAILRQHALPRR